MRACSSAGSGLCGGCSTNHPNGQILTPHYLLNDDGTPATRPVINTTPATATHGTNIAVTTNSAIWLVLAGAPRLDHAHGEQRPAPHSAAVHEHRHQRVFADDPEQPGSWCRLLHAVRDQRSRHAVVSKMVRIGGDAAPKITNPGTQTSVSGSSVNLAIAATTPTGTLTYGATGCRRG